MMTSISCRHAVLAGTSGLLALTLASGALAAPKSCADMAGLKLKDVSIISATDVDGGGFTPAPTAFRTLSGGKPTIANLPAFCRVVAVIAPSPDSAIRAEVWLPKAWNGKYDGQGNMGQGGTILYDAMAAALRRGYATSATDLGHNGDTNPFDATWALHHPERIVDYGYRSTHLTAVLAEAVTADFYGDKPKYSYFEGCSQGGQEAMMEAQRFPEDYDGIIAGNADYAALHHYIGGHLYVPWLMYADKPGYLFSAGKAKALGDAVNAACDKLDGVADGVIENPKLCKFDPAQIQCGSADGPNCLMPSEVALVRKLYAGPNALLGAGYYGGYARGGESATWGGFITGVPLENKEMPFFGNFHFFQGLPILRDFVFDDPNWDWKSWNWKTDPARAANARIGKDTLAHVLDADSPDLSKLARRNGKLLQYHGWADPNVSPETATAYHDRVQASMKGKTADATYRLFMVPGMGHCQGGPGPDRFDMLTAMEQWVEHGKAPEQIPAAHMTAGKIDRTRILCSYPKTAKYDGRGDPNDAASFRCAAG